MLRYHLKIGTKSLKIWFYRYLVLRPKRVMLTIMGHWVLWHILHKMKPRGMRMREKLINITWCKSSKSVAIVSLRKQGASVSCILFALLLMMKLLKPANSQSWAGAWPVWEQTNVERALAKIHHKGLCGTKGLSMIHQTRHEHQNFILVAFKRYFTLSNCAAE